MFRKSIAYRNLRPHAHRPRSMMFRKGFSGVTRKNRTGLDSALTAVTSAAAAVTDRQVVLTTTKFDRLARDMAEAGEILTRLRERDVLFGLGSPVYDWHDPFGKLFLQNLAMVAEFEANLNHLRTREGMAKARAKGRLEGKQPKLPLAARKTIHRRYHDPHDDVSLADLAEEYSVGRSTINTPSPLAEPKP